MFVFGGASVSVLVRLLLMDDHSHSLTLTPLPSLPPSLPPSLLQVCISLVAHVWSVPHTHSRTTTAFACIFQCFFCQQVQQSCSASSPSPEPSEEPHSEMVKMTKSKTFQAYLPNCHRTYSCIHCRAHLANHDELISKVRRSRIPAVPTVTWSGNPWLFMELLPGSILPVGNMSLFSKKVRECQQAA